MIIGDRVRLRAINHDDLQLFVEWLNDPEVIEGLEQYFPLSIDQEEKWFENMLSSPPEEHPMMIEVKSNDGWLPVGNCGFMKIDWRVRSAEFGIFIGEKQYWSQGFGTEAVQLLMQHGFDTLNLNRVFLRVYETNKRAIRAYEKVGFSHEGRLRKAHFYNGEYMDVLLMSMLRQEWKNKT